MSLFSRILGNMTIVQWDEEPFLADSSNSWQLCGCCRGRCWMHSNVLFQLTLSLYFISSCCPNWNPLALFLFTYIYQLLCCRVDNDLAPQSSRSTRKLTVWMNSCEFRSAVYLLIALECRTLEAVKWLDLEQAALTMRSWARPMFLLASTIDKFRPASHLQFDASKV